ncbi:serine protease 55-like [Rhinatrema bivittatum]|uniref:serine protease 55-like n=1 Tax=Rhinatrema bivittatum TaxID=194408 RepID=UPI001126D27C|nr:serine protease 55-like [Rhinatrema bivittatum]
MFLGMDTLRYRLKVCLCLLPWIIGTCRAECGFRADYDGLSEDNSSSRGFRQSRIIGGRDALPGEWPWAVSLQIWNQHFCAGSILNAWWIISAAHCLSDSFFRSKFLRVEVGATILQETKELIKVKKIITHKNYSGSNSDNDIALLLLASPIEFNVLKTPVCLPPSGNFKNEDWTTCFVVGWGTTEAGKTKLPKVLQKVEMVLIDWTQCMMWLWKMTTNMMCAGYEEGGRDACQGDSGGPLVCKKWNEDRWYQVGIVSWGYGCAERRLPGVYTLVSNYVNWIETETAEAGESYVREDLFKAEEEEEEEEEAEAVVETMATPSAMAEASPPPASSAPTSTSASSGPSVPSSAPTIPISTSSVPWINYTYSNVTGVPTITIRSAEYADILSNNHTHQKT